MCRRSSLAVLLAAALAAASVAQNPPDPSSLDVLDPAIDDLGSLAWSLRDLETGLGSPAGFDTLYAVPGAPNLRMRVNGALYAVFPRSTFEQREQGAVPVVPADTVFFIGPPDTRILGSQYGMTPGAGPAAPLRADLRTDTLVAGGADGDPLASQGAVRWDGRIDRLSAAGAKASGVRTSGRRADGSAPEPTEATVVTDRAYRDDRIRQLLRWASRVSGG